MIYQAFFAFIHLGTNATEDAFYADLAQKPEVLKSVFLFIAVLLGDALVVRLHIPQNTNSTDKFSRRIDSG